MDNAAVKAYLLNKPEALEDYPFGAEVTVFKVQGKIFALMAQNNAGVWQLNLKCDPAEAVQLRDVFDAVIPGYHMNKQHWNKYCWDMKSARR